MVFKEVATVLPDEWKPVNDGESIEGVYLQKKPDVGPNKSNIYVIDCVDGIKRSVWGLTVLDDKMSYVKEGDTIRITYKGMEKNYKKFIVEKDEPEDTE